MSDRIAQPYAIPTGQPIAAPFYYASHFSIQATANDFTIVLHDTIPISDGSGVSGDTELRRPVAILKLSPQSAKDFGSVLHDAIQRYEALYGVRLITDLSSETSG